MADGIEVGMAVEMALEIRELAYTVGDRTLMKGLNLSVERGQSIAVMGPSGSGKSTLLSLVLGLVPAGAGQIVVAGRELTGLRSSALARARREHLGMIFQFGELLPELTPVENVAVAALLAGTEREAAYQNAQELLDGLGVPTGDLTSTADLSGGERQRTAIARALIGSPDLLLADEPTGALDHATKLQVCDLLFALPQARNCGMLLVTHDAEVAARADRVLQLQDGHLVAPTSELTGDLR
ncbi:ABC transporter ATP-binding protein [Streptomyces sp. NPDC048442]|uniref:ABC transporter ATP-binding protein n=1 Tax=Streptomyces sp. NPDC048442 TaxID=3154823 RepID=UPI003432C04D